MKSRRGTIVMIGASLVMPLVVLIFMWRYTPSYPLPIDDWIGSLDVARAAATGTNPLSTIFAPVNHIHKATLPL